MEQARVLRAPLWVGLAVIAAASWLQTAPKQVLADQLKLKVQQAPSDPFAHYHLAVALYQEGKLDAAAAEFRDALALKPGLAEAHNDLGIILDRQSKRAAALKEFRSAVQANPRYLEARYKLAAALLGLGKAQEA